MGIEFEPISKYIKITSPTTTLTALEIYSSAMDWCDDQPTMGYTVPIQAVGKFDMGGGVYSDSIFMLINGWKIKFWSGTYQAVITGTLLGEPGESRTVPPDSGNVEVVFQVSSQGTVILDPAEWTQTEKNGIISDVDEIQTKLPSDPSSQSQVESHVTMEVDDLITRSKGLDETHDDIATHDSDVKGPLWTEESLKEIKEVVDDIKASGVGGGKPKSIAQYLERS